MLSKEMNHEEPIREVISSYKGINIFVELDPREKHMINTIPPEMLTRHIKLKAEETLKRKKDLNSTLGMFTESLNNEVIITRKNYYNLLYKQESIVYKRSINNDLYARYILPLLTVRELKEMCGKYGLKGFSRLNKFQIIELFIESLRPEEIDDFLFLNEEAILEREIKRSQEILSKKSKEALKSARVVNKDRNDLEMVFTPAYGEREIETFVSINDKNIKDCERFCTCNAEDALCRHFWIGFQILRKAKRFNEKKWKLSPILPSLRLLPIK